jgi:DNA-binding response OmpR family regulator
MAANILVVDDDDSFRSMIVTFLQIEDHYVDGAGGVKDAMELVQSNDYDVLIVDKNMPGLDGNREGGLDLLRYVHSQFLSSEVIMMTGYPTVETVIQAMKLGAFDYISKPFSLEDLRLKVTRLLEYRNFIDPDYTIGVYRSIREELFNLLDNRSGMSESELDQALLSLNKEIDKLFKVLRESERLVLVERESLSRIASLAEQLRMDTPKDDRSYGFLEEISRLSATRV